MMPGWPEPNAHGGDLDTARAAYPEAIKPWIDLSTGINPNPYPVNELDLTGWARLPQRSQGETLRQAAAAHYGADHADMIAAAPGTQALIQVIPCLFARSRVAIVSPTYSEHATAWQREMHDVVPIADLSEVDDADIVVVVNPNNPTGHTTPVPALRSLAAALHERSGLLVVDEAFADVVPRATSIIPSLPPATIVLRSFGKTYGLPGLRLGFAVSQVDVVTRLRDMLGPWCVSVPAISVGTRALADDRWLKATLENLESASRRLDALLASCGCAIIGGTPLFRLSTHASAHKIADALGRNGILVRRFPQQPTWLRFGLPRSEDDWQRLHDVLHAATNAQAVIRGGMPS